MTDPNDKWLDAILDDARDARPQVPDALMARVLADAAAAHAPPEPVMSNAPRGWAAIAQLLGGMPALGGLATAAVAGLWLGIAPPPVIETFSAGLFGDTVSVNILEVDDFILAGDIADG
ncbi:hypothetical protein [Yoonia sp. SS1-5]|uniref:Dihydroorotate dehydrogenase n=2 Tax=Yoonia rhodophyticola TaxID=3137370 RepID=A0ABZ3JCE9_9RHOB